MARTQTPAMGALNDVLDLAAMLRPGWGTQLRALRAAGVPLNADDGDDDSDSGAAVVIDTKGGAVNTDAGAAGADALGDAGKQALAAERKARRDAEKAARDLQARVQEFEQRDMTEQQKLEKRAKDAEQRLTPLESENLRLKVALQKGLVGDKASLVERLRGNTEKELLADADELLKLVGGGGAGNGGGGSGFDGGARGDAPATDMDTLIRQRAGYA